MSANYKLQPREGTQTFHKITCGRKWVGRVVQHDDGDWIGVMGSLMLRRPTRQQAFDDVVAQHLGYPSGAALRARNAQVRRARLIVDRAADYVVSEMERGNTAPMNKALSTDAGAMLALRGMVRSMRRVSRRAKR